MKKLILLIAILLYGCDPKIGQPYEANDIYLKDASGRCLVLSRYVSISGSENFQTGNLEVRQLSEGLPCIAPPKASE